MSPCIRVGSGCILLCFLLTAAAAAASPDPAPAASPKKEVKSEPKKEVKSEPKKEAKSEPKKEPKKELSAAQIALRDRVRQTLATLRQQPFNTGENTVADVIAFCTAFGCETEIHQGGQNGQRINGITCLCWNMPCGGSEPLMSYEGHFAPRIGFGYQDSPSQMAMMLAMSRVPSDYPVHVGDVVRTVADLIEHEKRTCRSGTDLSLKLVALCYYVHEPTWKNDLGEEWSLGRIVKEELGRSLASLPDSSSARLLGLSYAVEQRRGSGQPLDGEFSRASQYVEECCDYAWRSQSPDGGWGRMYDRDDSTALSASGRMLQWLVIGLPPGRLENAHIVQAVEYVENLLGSKRYAWNVQSLSSGEIRSVMRAAHSLAVYDHRVYAPADPEPEPEASPAPAAAK